MYELKIKLHEWIIMVFIGVVLGAFIGILIWQFGIMDFRLSLFFGGSTGFFITLFASLLVSFSLKTLIQNNFIAYLTGFLSTFISGTFGFLFTYYIFSNIDGFFQLENPFFFSIMIGMISYLIGFMFYWIISQKLKEENLQKELIHSKLQMYEAQLNPHFLFNALSTVTEIMHQDVNLADKAMIKLSSLLRQSIQQTSKISLKSEIENIKNLVWLVNIEDSNNIELNIDINEKMMNLKVPKFSLELLVENSIKHAKKVGEVLKIDVYLVVHQNSFDLIVEDNGKGFDTIKKGIGLNNLEDRLRLLHNASLEYSSKEKTKFIIKGLK
jgi:two-component system LytT family sensor kinase